jgi:hypothetical protein
LTADNDEGDEVALTLRVPTPLPPSPLTAIKTQRLV